MWEAGAELSLAIDGSKPPEAVTLSSDDGVAVAAQRYRLAPMALDASRPLPTTGKLVVRHGGRTAEALLSLPAASSKAEAAAAPSGLWLTAGLLAQDGFALQLKLKRTEAPKERDKQEGNWYIYHPVGGAITLADLPAAAAAAPPPAGPKISSAAGRR